VFPLTPFYPVEEPERIDMKDRLAMDSGKWFIAANGTDLRVWELTGICTLAERKTLELFYETNACCGCTFSDGRYTPAEDHVVVFAACPTFSYAENAKVIWKCRLIETTVA
jgi:hypothetical protein